MHIPQAEGPGDNLSDGLSLDRLKGSLDHQQVWGQKLVKVTAQDAWAVSWHVHNPRSRWMSLTLSPPASLLKVTSNWLSIALPSLPGSVDESSIMLPLNTPSTSGLS